MKRPPSDGVAESRIKWHAHDRANESTCPSGAPAPSVSVGATLAATASVEPSRKLMPNRFYGHLPVAHRKQIVRGGVMEAVLQARPCNRAETVRLCSQFGTMHGRPFGPSDGAGGVGPVVIASQGNTIRDYAKVAKLVNGQGKGATNLGREVGGQRMTEGGESASLVKAMEAHPGRQIDAAIAEEIGGTNAITQMIAAVHLGLPMVGGNGMGRDFPEEQVTAFFINGRVAHPAALADFEGNALIATEARTPEMLERLLRAATVATGSAAYFATAPMIGNFVRAHAMPRNLCLAWKLGDAVLSAGLAKADPVAAICAELWSVEKSPAAAAIRKAAP